MSTKMGSAVIGVVSPPSGGSDFFSVPTDLKAKIESIAIDNKNGTGDRVLNLRDKIVTDPAVTFAGTTTPSATVYANRGQYSIGTGLLVVLDKNQLAGLEITDTLNICADATDAGCVITVNYDLN
jgi:hypothetical protein